MAFEGTPRGMLKLRIESSSFGGSHMDRTEARAGTRDSMVSLDAWSKATGGAKFNSDSIEQTTLHAALVTSPYAHARILSIDTSQAEQMPGVKAVITCQNLAIRCGTWLADRPILAGWKVRYYGEPVAAVVAMTQHEALRAIEAVKVAYEPLPVVNSIADAMKLGAPLVHEDLDSYIRIKPVIRPRPGTNIAHHQAVRKGDISKAWRECDEVVEASYSLPQSDHAALETRSARVELTPDGRVNVHSSSQGPFIIRKNISRYFGVDKHKIIVTTPVVGGSFGGKQSVQLELIAFLASRAVGGQAVQLTATREQDMASCPVRIGLDAHVKLGARRDGRIVAAEFIWMVDSGAYTDMAVVETTSIAADCTGPYAIDNVWCDSYCVYTNHPFATSFRGFGHLEYTFCLERTMDKLALALGMDPLELRLANAIGTGHTSPTRTPVNSSNAGSLAHCIGRLKSLMNWDEGQRIEVDGRKVRAKGVACMWKNSSTPPNAISSAILKFTPDGSLSISCGAVDMGQGAKTGLVQLLAERLRMSPDRITINVSVNTELNPDHWKTVASATTYMAGRAVLNAADDLLAQLKSIAGVVLKCPEADLDVAEEKVFLRDHPEVFVPFRDIVHGYMYPNGNSVGGQIIGRGSFIMRHLTPLDEGTGEGKPGPGWTVGAQGVEVEFDSRDCTYRLLKAVTVIDAGRVINPALARLVVAGGMSMGLSLASREALVVDDEGRVMNPGFRTYQLMRYSEQPEYVVEFVETPNIEGPMGARGLGEHGIIGTPVALANALSSASGVDLNTFPLTPECIWSRRVGLTGDSM